MEEHIGTRINQNRVNEAALTLAHAEDPSHALPRRDRQAEAGPGGRLQGPGRQGTVAVACPFCMTMLRDAVNETGRESIKVKDVAELVAESMGPPTGS